MQRNDAIEAFTVALVYAGGRADAVFARLSDLTLPPPLPRELAEAPAEPQARARFLARRGLARRAVARRLDCAVEHVTIGRSASGAPVLLAPDARLHLALSGRDDLVAVALAEAPVGVDIEPVGAPFEAPLNVLHPDERAALAAMGADAHDHFMRLWTAKEAYLKALGTGFAREPAEIAIALAAPARIDGAIHRGGAGDVAIVDRGVPVRLATAFVQRLLYCGQPVALGCIVLPPKT